MTPQRILYLGPAGSGKTTHLRRRFVELVAGGIDARRILFLVGNRKAARAAQEAVLRECARSLASLQILTWHAYALGLVDRHYRDLGHDREPQLLTAPEQFKQVRDLLAEDREHRLWGDFAHVVTLRGFAEELRELILRAQDRLLSPEQVEAFGTRLGRPEIAEAGRFFRRYLTSIDDQSLLDHSNAVAQAIALLQKRNLHIERPEAILVDDYHDVTPAQETLLLELARPGIPVAVAGDPDSHVFGFRGTSLAPLRSFTERFAPAETVELGSSRRGAPVTDAWVFDHLAEEAEAIVRECLRLHAREGIGWGSIAVIVRRYSSPSRAIRRALDAAAVPYVVVGEDRQLAAEPALRPMIELVRAALNVGDREDALPGILASPVVGLDSYEVRALRRESRLRETTLSGLVAGPPADLPGRLAEALRELHRLFDDIAGWNASKRPDEVFWLLWERLGYFRAMVEEGSASDLDAVETFARQVSRYAERGKDRERRSFSGYLDVLDAAEFGPERWSVSEERRPGAVRLLTAHHAVGLEFDAAIVAGCVEGEFPNLRDTRAMLDLRDLDGPSDPGERAAERLEEERRLFGVAATRARRRLLFTAARETSQGQPLAPSRLVERIGVAWERPAPSRDALTRDEIECLARRTLADRSAPPEERVRALEQLARLPGVDPAAWWYEKDWTDPGTPLVVQPLLTSYSRLSSYDNCPLQYLYRQELGLDPERSHQMSVGSWVHDIIDGAAKGEIPSTEDGLVAALEERWDTDVFPSIAVEHRFRTDAAEMLRRWLATDGKEKPLESEVEFRFPLGEAMMRGKIDRVVRLGGKSVRLVDYKTSRNAKSQEEIDGDLQLASYYLALKRDPKLVELGEPIYLQLAFLGAFTRDGGFMRRGVEVNKRPSYEQEAEERLLGFIAGITSESFRPSPSADCRWCSFKPLCPVWPEGDEVPV